ncbi:class I SAM-dependent methyltransferase [Methylobacterium sp. A54F]
MNHDQINLEWYKILQAGSSLRPIDAVTQQLIDYSSLPEDEVRYIAKNSNVLTKAVWEKSDRTSDRSLQDFYDAAYPWVFGTLTYHAKQAEGLTVPCPPLPVQVAQSLANTKPGRHLDFGAGVATASLLFAKLGWDVDVSDVSKPLLEFSKWRLKQHGVPAKFIALDEQELEPNAYDLITAFNTFAHVPHPQATMERLNAALKPGGMLVFDIDSREPGPFNSWFLYRSHNPFIKVARRAGFSRKSNISYMYCYEKVERSYLNKLIVSAFDELKYNSTTTNVIHALRSAKGFAKRLLKGKRLRLKSS